jgi:undecaprenyl diphosphate synthase
MGGNCCSFCKAEAEFVQKYIENCKKNKIRLVAVGQKTILPDYLYKIITQAEEITKKFNRKTLYLCVAYDPFIEIQEVLKNTNGSFTCNDLLVNKPLNLVIRSGGANLFSNFLPLQSGFARLYVSNKLFNDMTHSDFMQFINQYIGIEQIYGE